MIDLNRTPLVLIVDNSSERAARFRGAVQDEPWDVYVVASEHELTRKLEETVPDLILVADDVAPDGAVAVRARVGDRLDIQFQCRWLILLRDPAPEVVDSAYAAGVSEYLTESAPAAEIRARLGTQLEMVLARRRFATGLLELDGESSGLLERAALGIGYARMPDGRFVAASPYLCEMLGYTRAELLDLSFHDIIDPVFFDDSMREIGALAAGERRFLVDDLKVKRKDQVLIWIQVTLSIVRDERSGTDYLVGILIDVTERKEVQDRLIQSDARFRDIARTMAGWYWELDMDGRFTFVSDRATEYLGSKGISIEEAKAQRCATIPAGRYGTPEEFGAACAFLCLTPSSRAFSTKC